MTAAARILIADDEPAIVASLEFLMRREGFEVAVARDGASALARAESWQPDVVLLDVMLPALDGLEVCRRLQRLPATARPAVVMLSARGAEADIARGREAGADRYLVKPFSTQELVAMVRALVAG